MKINIIRQFVSLEINPDSDKILIRDYTAPAMHKPILARRGTIPNDSVSCEDFFKFIDQWRLLSMSGYDVVPPPHFGNTD